MFYSYAPDNLTYYSMMALALVIGMFNCQGGPHEKRMGRLAGIGFTVLMCGVTTFMIGGDTKGYDWSIHLLLSTVGVLVVSIGTSIYLARQAKKDPSEKPPMPTWLHNSLAALVVLLPLLLFVFPQTDTWKWLKQLIFG